MIDEADSQTDSFRPLLSKKLYCRFLRGRKNTLSLKISLLNGNKEYHETNFSYSAYLLLSIGPIIVFKYYGCVVISKTINIGLVTCMEYVINMYHRQNRSQYCAPSGAHPHPYLISINSLRVIPTTTALFFLLFLPVK